MLEHSILITVRLLDGRYHGVGDWPPSPFRLFQAFMSAANAGRAATDSERKALEWLEKLDPPVIAAPKARKSKSITYYVPNNDLDSVDGDSSRIAEIRTSKQVAPWLFDGQVPFLYVWSFDGNNDNARVITSLADLIYQFGRGVDMAYATADIIDIEDAEHRLREHEGTVHRPTINGSGNYLRCPKRNASLDSLMTRYAAQLKRLTGGALRQAPPAVFRSVSYDSPPTRLLFDIIRNDPGGGFDAQPTEQIAALAERIRNHAAARLASHVGDALVERIIIGRNAGEAEKEARVRIIPLPSIGFVHTDRQVRRIFVEVPSACPIQTDDIAWAFSGLDLGVDAQTGEVLDESGPLLIRSEDRTMLSHYGVEVEDGRKARVWRTVTPAALPLSRRRGRIGGRERAENQAALAHAARQAIRHTGLGQNAEVRRVQREPFEGNGARAEAFAHGERFSPETLHHLEIAFSEPMPGPIVIGDGRYLGLGLMAPVPEQRCDAIILPLHSATRLAVTERGMFLHAVRRALMARDRDLNGAPSRLFSGHEPDGAPARSGWHDHVFLAADDMDGDGHIDRLLIVAPWRADRCRGGTREERMIFEQVSIGLRTVRAGMLGVVALEPAVEIPPEDHLFRPSMCWKSTTPYVPTHYPRRADVRSGVENDLILECVRRGLPRPKIEVTRVEIGPRGSVHVNARLTFAVAVRGPVMLGRDSHEGGGLFCAED